MEGNAQPKEPEVTAHDVFTPALAHEITSLEGQTHPELAPIAYKRLENIEKFFDGIMVANTTPHKNRELTAKGAKWIAPAVGGIVIGKVLKSPEITETSIFVTGGMSFIFLKKFMHLGAQKALARRDNTPVVAAVGYLNAAMRKHPGRPQVASPEL